MNVSAFVGGPEKPPWCHEPFIVEDRHRDRWEVAMNGVWLVAQQTFVAPDKPCPIPSDMLKTAKRWLAVDGLVKFDVLELERACQSVAAVAAMREDDGSRLRLGGVSVDARQLLHLLSGLSGSAHGSSVHAERPRIHITQPGLRVVLLGLDPKDAGMQFLRVPAWRPRGAA